jgi:hypothetical protein
MLYLLSDNDACYDKSNRDFITFKVKIGIKDLGNDVYFENMKFYIVETDEARRNRVSSLKTCRLQDQLVIGKFGRVVKPFSRYRDSSCGSAVLQTRF